MDIDAFKTSVTHDAPPVGLSLALQALWQDAKGNWDTAHELAQAHKDETGAWVHAYLHRVEGDLSNADFWYARAGRARPECGTDEEWTSIATELLERGG